MIIASNTNELTKALRKVRAQKESLAFVPTMGNLHEGHLSLIRQGLSVADKVAVSIFINPMQFCSNEDLGSYPRTLKADLEMLHSANVSLAFTPTEADIYPYGIQHQTTIQVPALSQILCGAFRPGHFDGVCTVIYKLFHLIQPEIALFGEKDLQQLLVLKKMVTDLNLDVDILGGPTHRAADGLALSSRNKYLSKTQRELAPLVWQTLTDCMQNLCSANGSDTSNIIGEARSRLEATEFTVDYLELRELAMLELVEDLRQDCALFVAARLGNTRLIDNIKIKGR